MDDKEIQTKLNQLAKICNELQAEATRRYGAEGRLFFDADGHFHIMDGDSDGSAWARQEHVRFSSKHCNLGSGAW